MANLDASLTAVLNRFINVNVQNGPPMSGILTDATGDSIVLNTLMDAGVVTGLAEANRAAFVNNLTKVVIPKAAIVSIPHAAATTAIAGL